VDSKFIELPVKIGSIFGVFVVSEFALTLIYRIDAKSVSFPKNSAFQINNSASK
jgi:hypothetical protein